MQLFEYLIEKYMVITVNLFSMFALAVFLRLLGLSAGAVFLILFCWVLTGGILLGCDYRKLTRRYRKMHQQLDRLDQKYLICEMLDKPENCMEKIYHEMLKSANKSMLEEVRKAKEVQQSYKEYIEEWVHEIKTPITAIDLICENHQSDETARIHREVRNIHYLVEQTLYYARSEVVEKDYFIKEIQLFDVVQKSIMQHKSALLENHISLTVDETEAWVCTDEKWIGYILEQIFTNAVKYRKDENAQIHICAEKSDKGVALLIRDNGKGIDPADLPRVFEKGFTGGDRENTRSTGLGLYICKKLCDRLGLVISAKSELGIFTEVTVFFPVGRWIGDCITSNKEDLQNCK